MISSQPEKDAHAARTQELIDMLQDPIRPWDKDRILSILEAGIYASQCDEKGRTIRELFVRPQKMLEQDNMNAARRDWNACEGTDNEWNRYVEGLHHNEDVALSMVAPLWNAERMERIYAAAERGTLRKRKIIRVRTSANNKKGGPA
ncbi:MAG: hypothetical protein OXT65_05960 [Alphaproteobacteria bacterium]|nr:hypothetical protein [Alphaproteobacteria bacterium]